MDEIDYWRTAHQMMKQHGLNAGFEAAKRSDELRDQGDLAGFHAWRKILGIINTLEARGPVDTRRN